MVVVSKNKHELHFRGTFCLCAFAFVTCLLRIVRKIFLRPILLSGPVTRLVLRSVENHQALFLSGRQSPLAGMCFIRRLPQECCSNGRQFRDGRRKLCFFDAIVESGEIEVSFLRSFCRLVPFQFLYSLVYLSYFRFSFVYSLIQFFSKMKKWLDMSNAAGDFRKKIELLERNFHVSTVIFKKYEPIFLEIFKDPREENTKTQRGRKSR